MKRVITPIILLFISLTMVAQIQRNFWGCELGEKEEKVRQILTSKGFKINEFIGKNSFVIKEQTFGGIYFKYAIFEFYNNQLMGVAFWKEQPENNNNDIISEFERLKKKLKEKYNNYIIKDENETTIFFDNFTNIAVDLNFENKVTLILSYNDDKLFKMKEKCDQEEL